MLCDCPLAKGVWCNLLKSEARESFYMLDLQEWITMNLYHELGNDSTSHWGCVWVGSYHFLWNWRNRESHGEEQVRPSHSWQSILGWVQQYRQADVSAIGGNVRQKMEIDVLWKKPEVGWIRLNTNRASRINIAAGSGGLFRNQDGKWLGDFS